MSPRFIEQVCLKINRSTALLSVLGEWNLTTTPFLDQPFPAEPLLQVGFVVWFLLRRIAAWRLINGC